jgi:hypothetical protein
MPLASVSGRRLKLCQPLRITIVRNGLKQACSDQPSAITLRGHAQVGDLCRASPMPFPLVAAR